MGGEHVVIGVPKVRCKLRCVKKETYDSPSTGGGVKLIPVMGESPENKDFFRWTPSGVFEFSTISPPAFDFFEIGRDYYIDVTAAPPADEVRARLERLRKVLAEYEAYKEKHPGGTYDDSIRLTRQAIERDEEQLARLEST